MPKKTLKLRSNLHAICRQQKLPQFPQHDVKVQSMQADGQQRAVLH
jgi:hypothetical protein